LAAAGLRRAPVPELKMWSNDAEYVIAATAERASELTILQLGADTTLDPESYAPEAFSEIGPEQTFTFHHDGEHQTTKPVKEWIAERGEGWFATSEF
jgi:hypothetical protein